MKRQPGLPVRLSSVGSGRTSQNKAHHEKSSYYETCTFILEEFSFSSNGCLSSVLDTS